MSTVQHSTGTIGRREFMAGAAAAAAFTIVKPTAVRGTQANSTIELGMIGCGGRGTWLIPLFEQNAPFKVVACCDYYEDHVNTAGDKHKIDPSRRFSRLSGYKKLLDTKLDAVAIESPPYFHPEQTAAAVEAGKHVFLSKPIAVDVPGCQSIGASGKKATEKKLVCLVDFQTRTDPAYQETLKRVHAGDIGKLIFIEARYPWAGGAMDAPKTDDDRLRRWYCIKEIGGDHIVEQAIHTIDVATWFANADPVKAVGAGGSKGLRKYGNIWDFFAVTYHFPDNVLASFSCNQCTPGTPDSIPCRAYGSKGCADTDYFNHAWITGEKPYEGSTFPDLYTRGAVTNIKDFYKQITEGDYANTTVPPSVRSNLTAVLGRNAAYKGGTLTWDELLKANEKLELDLSKFKA